MFLTNSESDWGYTTVMRGTKYMVLWDETSVTNHKEDRYLLTAGWYLTWSWDDWLWEDGMSWS
jgi:hypothetical protein